MADTVSVHVPLVEMRQDGAGRWSGYITTPWFRYLLNSNPAGFGTGTGVLHGNASGAPTWGPVDLAADVTGVLPVANGGLGGISATIGGLLYFSTATQVSSSGALASAQLILGGGTGAPTSLGAGTSSQVLHGGTPPTWGGINLVTDVAGTLSVAHGGTGTTTSTGSGDVVLSDGASLNGARLDSSVLTNAEIDGFATFGPLTNWQWVNVDSNVVSVTGVATTLFTQPAAGFFVAHDKTSGGMSAGVVDHTAVTMIASGIAGVTFSVAASVLQATVTAGANPRSISVLGIAVGSP